MYIPRIFISSKLYPGQKIVLGDSQSKHIILVLRLKEKEQLIVFNGLGGEFNATVFAITNKHQAIVIVGDFIDCKNESLLHIHLGQGVARGEKMDFTIQKSTELGVNVISPLLTQRCNVQLKNERLEKKLNHWQNVAINAAEQSKRCYVPKVLPAQSLKDWVKLASGLCLVLDPQAKTNNQLVSIKTLPESITVLVGPEGGLETQEIDLAIRCNFLPIKLGPRVLRTETAALVIISILQAKWGDLKEI